MRRHSFFSWAPGQKAREWGKQEVAGVGAGGDMAAPGIPVSFLSVSLGFILGTYREGGNRLVF